MSGCVCGVRGDAWGVVPCLVCPFERLRSDLSFGSHFCGIDLIPNRSIDCERATGTVKPVPTTVSGTAAEWSQRWMQDTRRYAKRMQDTRTSSPALSLDSHVELIASKRTQELLSKLPDRFCRTLL